MCNRVQRPESFCPKLLQIMILLILFAAAYIYFKFRPVQEDMTNYSLHDNPDDTLKVHLIECVAQLQATMNDAQDFLRGQSPTTTKGKCLVACILKRTHLITDNRINKNNVLQANRHIYGENYMLWDQFIEGVDVCIKVAEEITDTCEYAAKFHDCLYSRVDELNDRKNEMDQWGDYDDEF